MRQCGYQNTKRYTRHAHASRGMRRALVLRAARGPPCTQRRVRSTCERYIERYIEQCRRKEQWQLLTSFPLKSSTPPPHPPGRAFLVPQIASPPPFQIHAGWLVSRCRHHGSCWLARVHTRPLSILVCCCHLYQLFACHLHSSFASYSWHI